MSNANSNPEYSQKPELKSGPGSALKPVWYIALLAVMAVGAYFYITRINQGLAATNLSSTTPWGAWIAFYVYFVGLSAGAFLLSTLIYVFGMEQYEKVGRDALLVAILNMVVAMLFVLTDLGKMGRFMNALLYGNLTSPLAWEIRFYMIYIGILVAELYFSMRTAMVRAADRSTGWKASLLNFLTLGRKDLSKEAKEKDHKMLKILGSIGIPVAIFGVHGGTGVLFAAVKARAHWHSALFPIIFIISALVSGTALLIVSYYLRSKLCGDPVDEDMIQSIAGLLTLFLLIDVGFQFYEVLIPLFGLEHHELATLSTMFTGDYALVYWGLQIVTCIVLPLILLTRKSTKATVLGAALIVVGIIGVRFDIVVPALLVPVMHGLPVGEYAPNLLEWATSAGMIAFGLLLYTVCVQILPLTDFQDLEH